MPLSTIPRQCSGQSPRRWACLLPWVALGIWPSFIPLLARADVTLPAVGDTVTSVTQEGDVFRITGETVSADGGNLFHTFQQFSLTAEQTALFLANPQIQNILGRVVGGEASTIDGTLSIEGGNANLLLLNPSGLLFGPNAQLDLPGSFTASTAAGVGFGGEIAGEAVQWFYGQGNNDYGALSGSPNAFVFAPTSNGGAGAIAILGPLDLNDRRAQNPDGTITPQNLTLVGGTVVGTSNATLTTSGNITVTAVRAVDGATDAGTADAGTAIRIGQAGQVLQLELDTQTLNLGDPIAALSLPELLTGSGLASNELPADLNDAINETLAQGDVRLLGNLTTKREPTPGNDAQAGNVNVLAEGDLAVGAIDTSAQSVGLLDSGEDPETQVTLAQAGDVTLESQRGAVVTREVLTTANAQTAAFAGKTQAEGGNIRVTAATVATTANLDSGAIADDGSSSEARAGDITIQSGTVDAADVSAAASVDSVLNTNSLAQGGEILLTSDGDLNAGNLTSRATQLAGNQTETRAGKVTVTAAGQAEIRDVDASAEGRASLGNGSVFGGDVEIGAGAGLQTGDLTSHARGLASGRIDEAQSGNITLAAGGGDLTSGNINATVKTGAALAGNQLQGGAVQATAGGSIRVGDVGTSAQAEGAVSQARAGSVSLSNLSADAAAIPEQDVTIEFSTIDASASVRRVLALVSPLTGDANAVSVAQPGSIQVRSEGTLRGTGVLPVLGGEDSGILSNATVRAEALMASMMNDDFSFNRDVVFEAIGTSLGQLSPANLTRFFTTLVGTAITPSDLPVDGLPVPIPDLNPDVTPVLPSPDNAAVAEAGQITLQHRGGTQNLDFVVGQSSDNGTVGAVIGGEVLRGDEVFQEEGFAGPAASEPIAVRRAATLDAGVFPVLPEGGVAESTPARVRILSVNAAPTVDTTPVQLTTPAAEDVEIEIAFPEERPIRDRDGDRVQFVIEAVPNGTLRRGETVLQPGDTWSRGDRLTYTPDLNSLPDGAVGGQVVDGFSVVASDGAGQSAAIAYRFEIREVNGGGPGPTNPGPPPPGPTNPGPTDPGPLNPGPTDPSPLNPGPSNPGPSIPVPTDPGPLNPGPTDPSPLNPGPSNPGPSNPGPSIPGPTDPGPTDPDSPQSSLPTETDRFTPEAVNTVNGTIAAQAAEAESSAESGGSESGSVAANPFSNFEPTVVTSVEEATAVLSNVAEAAGVNPALVYVQFVPSTQGDGPDFGQREAQFTQALTQYLKGETGGLGLPQADSDELELLLVMPDGSATRKRLDVTRGEILPIAQRFQREVTDPRKTWSKTYLRPAQDLHRMLIDPIEAELQAQGIENISFIVDSGLRSLPFAALHDGESFLVERYSMGLMPSLSLADKSYRDLRQAEVLAMGASEFDQQSDLPAVETELELLTGQLWQGKAFVNDEFTLANLKKARQERPFGIVHLATHGEFRSGSVDQSFIQLWDEQLRLNQLRQLGLGDPPVDLLVLSACRTALGDTEAELGFAGLAIEAGVKSALGSLWHVSDAGTLALMTQFYQQLREVPIKAEALRQAQIAMLQGETRIRDGQLPLGDEAIALTEELTEDIGLERDLSHPYFWSAFTLVGNPW